MFLVIKNVGRKSYKIRAIKQFQPIIPIVYPLVMRNILYILCYSTDESLYFTHIYRFELM